MQFLPIVTKKQIIEQIITYIEQNMFSTTYVQDSKNANFIVHISFYMNLRWNLLGAECEIGHVLQNNCIPEIFFDKTMRAKSLKSLSIDARWQLINF